MVQDVREDELLFLMKKINIDMEIQLKSYLECEGMSGTQVYFMVYILRHHPKGTYISEMCREIGVSKATLSVLVKKLREKGYLYFEEDPRDIRKKKIIPAEKLIVRGNDFLQKAERMEAHFCGGLDSQEKECLWNLEQKFLMQMSTLENGRGSLENSCCSPDGQMDSGKKCGRQTRK